MGFASMDAIVQALTAGQMSRTDWNKLTHAVGAQTAGEWHCLFHSTGNPAAGVLNGGTNLSFQSCDETTTGAIRHGGIVTPSTKHILNASGFSAAATSMPAVMMLVDLLGYYPMSSTTTTGNQSTIHGVTATFANATDIVTHTGYDIADKTRVQLTNAGGAVPAGLALLTDYWTIRQSATTSKLASSYANAVAGTAIDFTTDGTGTTTITSGLPRYTDGAGVQQIVVCNTACGAATPNLSTVYTNAAGTGSRATPATLPAGKSAAGIGMIPYSGTGAGKFGPAMPLAAGDTGTRSLQSIAISASYVSGTLAYGLVRPLLTLPLTTIGVAAERDLLNQIPSLPRIYDGACLAWLMYAGAATPVASSFVGHLDFAWGA